MENKNDNIFLFSEMKRLKEHNVPLENNYARNKLLKNKANWKKIKNRKLEYLYKDIVC